MTAPAVGQPTAKYAPYRRMGDFVFLSGAIAVDTSRQRKLFFPQGAPVSTVVEVTGMLPTPDVLVEVEATAYLPEARK